MIHACNDLAPIESGDTGLRLAHPTPFLNPVWT